MTGLADVAATFVPVSRYTCTHCRSPRVTFIAPGSLEERSETGILVHRAVPVRCACIACRFLGLA